MGQSTSNIVILVKSFSYTNYLHTSKTSLSSREYNKIDYQSTIRIKFFD